MIKRITSALLRSEQRQAKRVARRERVALASEFCAAATKCVYERAGGAA